MGDLYVLPADLHNEDDDGHGWTLVALDTFEPAHVYPGAVLRAGRGSATADVRVLRTELLETTGGRTVVLVTFRPSRSGSAAGGRVVAGG